MNRPEALPGTGGPACPDCNRPVSTLRRDAQSQPFDAVHAERHTDDDGEFMACGGDYCDDCGEWGPDEVLSCPCVFDHDAGRWVPERNGAPRRAGTDMDRRAS